MKVSVLVFPGSNCDQDCRHVCEKVFGCSVEMVWHRETKLPPTDLVVIPGGFSYGDYLRAGAIARFAPIMAAVQEHAENGGLVFGICNGFQILLEAGMLPGAMRMNKDRRFICKDIHLKVENHESAFSSAIPEGKTLKVPIAHHEGNWVASEETYQRVIDQGQILFRYATAEGELTPESNPNGSMGNVAGLINSQGNVLGMMPHPERASETELGITDGSYIFESILQNFNQRASSIVS